MIIIYGYFPPTPASVAPSMLNPWCTRIVCSCVIHWGRSPLYDPAWGFLPKTWLNACGACYPGLTRLRRRLSYPWCKRLFMRSFTFTANYHSNTSLGGVGKGAICLRVQHWDVDEKEKKRNLVTMPTLPICRFWAPFFFSIELAFQE